MSGSSIFPFIVGCGRSGTTLLRAMLDSHPELAIPGESYFVVSMGRHRRRYERDGRLLTERFIADIVGHPRFRRWGLQETEVREALTPSPRGYPGAVRCVFALYAHREGKERYGDKTPSYVLNIPMLARLFPEARFVHIIRDGRDVALSLRDVQFGPGDIREAALLWKRSVKRGMRAGRQLGRGRYREVQYEELLDDPEVTLRGLCDFIELDYSEEMLSYPERAGAVLAPVRLANHPHLALPPTKHLRDWRRQMSSNDIALFEAVAGDL